MDVIPSLQSLNGNPLAAIDVETTGRIGGYHEVIQIAIVPMSLDLEIADLEPFYQNIAPEYPERVEPGSTRVHNLNVDDLMVNAPSKEKVLQYLVEWFDRLPLGHGRRLTPLAHNWAFEKSFLTPWLGPELMNSLFSPLIRDTMQTAVFFNDRSAMLGRERPFQSISLSALCKNFGIKLENAHDALADCQATAKLFKSFMRATV
jgi:DNA polymerase III epsilon subunit-like protein